MQFLFKETFQKSLFSCCLGFSLTVRENIFILIKQNIKVYIKENVKLCEHELLACDKKNKFSLRKDLSPDEMYFVLLRIKNIQF